MAKRTSELREMMAGGVRPYLHSKQTSGATRNTQLWMGGHRTTFQVRHVLELARQGKVKAELGEHRLEWRYANG